MRNNVRGAIALSATALMLAAATPVAAAPSSERIPIDIEFSDGFLSAECGVDVVTSITGFRIVREFVDGAGNLQSLTTISIRGVSSSEFGSVRIMDVGADQVKVSPDGTTTLTVTGQVPFEFVGALVFDFDAGVVVKEPQFRGEEQLAKVCRLLSDD
jgi:hypothetical protein